MFDFSAGAVTNKLPIPVRDPFGLENHMGVLHALTIRSVRDHPTTETCRLIQKEVRERRSVSGTSGNKVVYARAGLSAPFDSARAGPRRPNHSHAAGPPRQSSRKKISA